MRNIKTVPEKINEMTLCKCTFDKLPSEMQLHVLYKEKIPVSEYKLAIWNSQNTIYYNALKESEIKRFVTLIESEKKLLNSRTMESIYNQYGFAVYDEILDAHQYLLKKRQEKIAENIVAEYMPIIEEAMNKPSIPLSEELLKAMSHAAEQGKFKFREWSTNQTYIYFMGYLLGKGILEFDKSLL